LKEEKGKTNTHKNQQRN